MTESSEPFDLDLLASLALDALDEADEDAVLADVAGRPELAAELASLRNAASWLGAVAASPAPDRLRQSLLAGIAERPHLAVVAADIPGPVSALAGQVDDFGTIVDSLAPSDWGVPTRAGLTVHELVAHLVAVEAYTGGLVGLDPMLGAGGLPLAPDAHLDHMAMSEPTIERHRALDPGTTSAEWRRNAQALLERLGHVDLATRVSFHGMDMSVRSLCTLRTFELWVHGDDILDALARPRPATDPGRLFVMAQLAVRSVPLGMIISGGAPSDATVKFVLTGPSGGVWTQPLGSAPVAEPDAVIVVDVEQFCRLVGQRLMPDEVGADISGDRDLATRVLHAARVFAA
jgi:uncharacterized protein (TIGR03084 family)